MTNQTDTNYIFADTAAALITNDQGKSKVLYICWVSDEVAGDDIAADDDFLLSDANGKRIIGKRAEAAGDGLELNIGYPGMPVNGLTLTTLDGGVVYIGLA